MSLHSPTDHRAPPVHRLAGTLFLMAFGFALSSVCIFRVLSFTLSSTAFFMLYLAAAMPIGAYLASRQGSSLHSGLRVSIWSLLGLALVLPVIALLTTRGPGLLAESDLYLMTEFDLGRFWKGLVYQILVVSPLFVSWGFAEFLGYQVAIRSDSRALRNGFYLIFVWALAAALAVGFWSIPTWGWLRTVALVPFVALVARDLLGPTRARLRRAFPYAAVTLLWLLAGRLEPTFVRTLFPKQPFSIGGVLAGDTSAPWPGCRSDTSLLEATWGRYSHVSLARCRGAGGESMLLGAYDGVIMWPVETDDNATQYPLEMSAFDLLRPGADVAILGAGGGRQVRSALRKNPRRVVAVDVIPEVFDFLVGEYAWANGGIYESPLVTTVAADGRSYIRDSDQRFDLIMLPYTESFAAMFRALFEPGQRIHTTEAFAIMASRLKPNGILAVIKGLDKDQRLFRNYAASLDRAGLHVTGWLREGQVGAWPSGESFVLLATLTDRKLEYSASATRFLAEHGYREVDFAASPPEGIPIFDDSPWTLGVLGNWIPPERLGWIFVVIGTVAVGGIGIAAALSLAGRPRDEGVGKTLTFVLAGVGIGVHAVYLQNGVIFWLIANLVNPLSSFFVGTCLFLLAWGMSSTMLNRWRFTSVAGGVGMVAILLGLGGAWHSTGSLLLLGCIALGTGLFFPLLGLTFRTRLLHLFVADAFGGVVGGLLGIWVPVLYGLRYYFDLLPWVSLGTFALVGLTLWLSRDSAPDALASNAEGAR